MVENDSLYFSIDDIIDKYRDNYWSKNEETYLLSNVFYKDYSMIASVLNRDYDDVIYKVIIKFVYKEYIDDIFNKKYRVDEGNLILRKKYKLEYITDAEIEKVFSSQD